MQASKVRLVLIHGVGLPSLNLFGGLIDRLRDLNKAQQLDLVTISVDWHSQVGSPRGEEWPYNRRYLAELMRGLTGAAQRGHSSHLPLRVLSLWLMLSPAPTDASGRKSEPEMDRLSNILKTFNDHFGTLFTDSDRVVKRIRDDIAPQVAADVAYMNAKENTPHTARMAHDEALAKVMQHLLKDDTQVYKQFVENESFKRFVGDMVYALTSQ
jgi:hypothetical protein